MLTKKIATQGKIQLSDMYEAVKKKVTRVQMFGLWSSLLQTYMFSESVNSMFDSCYFCILHFLRQELGMEVKFVESQHCIFHHVNDSSETICTTMHTSTKLRTHNTHICLKDSSTEDALEMNESLYKDIYDI